MSDDRLFDPCKQGYHQYCVGTDPGEACICKCHDGERQLAAERQRAETYKQQAIVNVQRRDMECVLREAAERERDAAVKARLDWQADYDREKRQLHAMIDDARQRAERAEAWAGRWKRAAKAMRGNWNDAVVMGYWHSAVRAWAEKFKQESARAERAEQREQRLREALLTGGDCKPGECHPLCEEEGGHAIYVCMACANVVDTVDDARHVPGCIVLESARAALAGPPETVSDSLVSDTATTTLSDSEATGADTSPACTEAHHVVPAGSDACQCGGNRMERML